MAMLSTADAAAFLDDTRARGFNAVELALIGHDPRGRHVPFDDRGNSDQGWMSEMVANGPDRMRTYGEFIARRYAGRHNPVDVPPPAPR